MPLPAPNTAWPPAQLVDIYTDYDENDAWYAGDKIRLADLYSTRLVRKRDRQEYIQYLWAASRDLTRHETRLHIPLPGDIAATSADLMFSEPPTFTVDHVATQDRLDEILDEGGVHMRLLEAAEVCAGIGDVYLKLAWDPEVAKRPILAVEHGDAAIPVFRWGRLVEVTFWRELERSGEQVVRLLEHHEPGTISYAVFQGTSTHLGATVPLSERPETRDLPVDGRQTTGISMLTATHVPNMRPNRKHRGLPFGRSDYASPCFDLFDALDATWTSWMRDIRLAKARLIVPSGYLTNLGPGQGAAWDSDREVWEQLNMDPSQSGGITLNQFSIRVVEHQQTMTSIIEQAVRSAGYSAQTFGLAGEAAATATEVTARERRSMITRDRKGQYWIPALKRITEAMLALDKALGWSQAQPLVPAIEFGSAVSQDAESVARTIQMLSDAAAISTETKVRMAHPDWDEDQVADEVQRIKDDQPATVMDPLALPEEMTGPEGEKADGPPGQTPPEE
ncbi:phage portal protein [Streptosporangium sp. G12]